MLLLPPVRAQQRRFGVEGGGLSDGCSAAVSAALLTSAEVIKLRGCTLELEPTTEVNITFDLSQVGVECDCALAERR